MNANLCAKAAETLSCIVEFLLNTARVNHDNRSHWESVRATSLSVWALCEFIQSPFGNKYKNAISPILNKSCDWLDSKKDRDEKGNIFWESQIWDTSYSIFAFLQNNYKPDVVQSTTNWLLSERKDNCWYDDSWETTLSVISLLRKDRLLTKNSRNIDLHWLRGALKWFNDIPSKNSGKNSGQHLSPLYTGFLLWTCEEMEELLKSRKKIDIPIKEHGIFIKKVEKARDWALKELASSDFDLWSEFTFSNCFIIYALSKHNNYFGDTDIEKILNWFITNTERFKTEYTESCGLVVLALTSIFNVLNDRKLYEAIVDNIHIKLEKPKITCFLGCSNNQTTIAKNIIEKLNDKYDNLTFIEWYKDFKIGHRLFEHIEDAYNKSQVAIILLTKDRKVVPDHKTGDYFFIPSENITYEIGLFHSSSTVGKDRTILIAQFDKELIRPADFQDILTVKYDDICIGNYNHLYKKIDDIIDKMA